MLFNSLQFLIFMPLVLVIYYIFPQKIRYVWLLISSYYFYMCWNAAYAILLFCSTIITYLCGISIDYIKQSGNKQLKIRKACVIVCCALNFGILFFFKYFNFVADNIQKIFSFMNIELKIAQFDILLPVGISFYTFQAIGYTIDVYRNETYAEKNFFRYALFVSFFPQLVAGPIERSKNLLKQLAIPAKWSFEDFRDGLLLMIWGFFLKLVISDRAAIFVNAVYGDYGSYPGWYLIVGTLLFGIQIYCDFSGYSVIAMGAARMLGISLMVNFDAPYLSQSPAEFWRRWHISLSSWFKDYLYIPLGGNRKGKLRKYINLMITFIASGLWHGAQWGYVAWGGINGLYQIIGDMLKPIKGKVARLFFINPDSIGAKIVKTATTFMLINFSWIFFRADRLKSALYIIRSIFTVHNPWILFDGSLYTCGLTQKTFSMLTHAIGFLLVADFLKLKNITARNVIARQDYWCQILVIALGITGILYFGVYGPGFDAANFIYFQF